MSVPLPTRARCSNPWFPPWRWPPPWRRRRLRAGGLSAAPDHAGGAASARRLGRRRGAHLRRAARQGAGSVRGGGKPRRRFRHDRRGYVARAAPDGYTLYLNASIHAINPLLYKKTIKFDAVKDFTPISELAQGALIFSINPKVPANNVQELVKTLKADPQKYSFATTGFGSAGHLAAASFLHENGLSQIPIVLYRGGGPALSDLIGGRCTRCSTRCCPRCPWCAPTSCAPWR